MYKINIVNGHVYKEYIVASIVIAAVFIRLGLGILFLSDADARGQPELILGHLPFLQGLPVLRKRRTV